MKNILKHEIKLDFDFSLNLVLSLCLQVTQDPDNPPQVVQVFWGPGPAHTCPDPMGLTWVWGS